jgi:hypothetical protein
VLNQSERQPDRSGNGVSHAGPPHIHRADPADEPGGQFWTATPPPAVSFHVRPLTRNPGHETPPSTVVWTKKGKKRKKRRENNHYRLFNPNIIVW